MHTREKIKWDRICKREGTCLRRHEHTCKEVWQKERGKVHH